jgi:hypothetical protein
MVYSLLVILLAAAVLKIIQLKKAAREISAGFADRLQTDTNTLIDISSRDRDMRALAVSINNQLRKLRQEHHRYYQGNMELKNAITNISHDLRTPLTAICGYLDILQRTDDPEKRARYLSIMKDRTELMKQLTEELFRYSIIVSDESEMETENVFVNQVLAECISSFYPALTGKGIEPNIELTGQRIERPVNRAALERVFTNLLNNAVKYSDGDLEIRLTDEGEITFSNTAKGLSAIDVEQLFDRFYTVEAAHHSTGLGLSIARTLTERMGGTIHADYRNDRLTITVKL